MSLSRERLDLVEKKNVLNVSRQLSVKKTVKCHPR